MVDNFLLTLDFFIFGEVFGFWLNSAYGPYYGATLLFSWLFIFFGEIQPIRKNVAFGTGWILREKSVLGFLFLAFILGPTYHVRSWKKYFFHFYYSCWQYWLICCYFWPHISCQVMQVWRRKKSLALFLQFVRSAQASWLKPKIRDIWALHILTTFDD